MATAMCRLKKAKTKSSDIECLLGCHHWDGTGYFRKCNHCGKTQRKKPNWREYRGMRWVDVNIYEYAENVRKWYRRQKLEIPNELDIRRPIGAKKYPQILETK